jgi:DNA-binding MarR family transcriptional regulator
MRDRSPKKTMKVDDLETLENRLRRGKVPKAWMPAVEGCDSNTLLIILWAGRLSRRVDAFYQEALRACELKYSDYAVLSLLRFSGSRSPKQLNAYLAITSGGLTKTIQRLEKKKLVQREADPDDGRGTLISLTKTGERLVIRLFAEDVEAHEDLLSDLSSAERKRIAIALRDLLDAFERRP